MSNFMIDLHLIYNVNFMYDGAYKFYTKFDLNFSIYDFDLFKPDLNN